MLLLAAASTLGAAPALPRLNTLQPGGTTQLAENVTVNVVFVGYRKGAGPQQIDEGAFRDQLAAGGDTVVREPLFYGVTQPTNVSFNYQYHVVYANRVFEDAFFKHLTRIGQPGPITDLQAAYNDQVANTHQIEDNLYVDAPSVERWLAQNAGPLAKVDTRQYTVFLINWYSRPDFRHHVYTKTDEADPDTGYNFGAERQSRKIIAWGGTAANDPQGGTGAESRVWFYDLSAGPESWTDNWDLDDADVDGDGDPDYRMPPVWEYGNPGAYRPFTSVSEDLGLITRWVAVNLLFTSSPLYDPAINGPKLPSHVQLDLNTYEGDPSFNAQQYLNLEYISAHLGALQPLNHFSAESNDTAFTGEAEAVYRSWLTAFTPDPVSHYPNRLGDPYGDLFLFACDHQDRFLEHNDDYEVPVYLYSTTDDDLNPDGLLGFADDDWSTGIQSYVFGFTAPTFRDLGYGNTGLTIHEVGHHLGMSHPHDGYDPETGYDYGVAGSSYFTWAGDESNSVMGYLDLNYDFGQFDRDNMNRNMTAVYLNQANVILGQVVAAPNPGRVSALLRQADVNAAAARTALRSHRYLTAATQARDAYVKVVDSATRLGLTLRPARRIVCPPVGNAAASLEAIDGHHHRG